MSLKYVTIFFKCTFDGQLNVSYAIKVLKIECFGSLDWSLASTNISCSEVSYTGDILTPRRRSVIFLNNPWGREGGSKFLFKILTSTADTVISLSEKVYSLAPPKKLF